MAERTGKTATRRRPFSAPVWRNRDFVRLWSGQAFSQFGNHVSTVVVPLLAIETLHAGVGDLGLLGLLSKLPALLYIVAGVSIDRMRKRPTLIVTNLARAVLLLMIPVEVALGVLSIGLLGATLLVSAVLTVWFDTAYLSYLPGLVGREHLVEANSRMESARASAQLTGPSLGGVLVQAVTAPVAIILDGLAVLASVFMLGRIRHKEPVPERKPGPTSGQRWPRRVWGEVAAGIRFLARHPVLGPLMLAITINNVAWAAETTLYVIYLVSVMDLPASLVGLTLLGAGPGAVVGALAAGPVARRIGLGGAIWSGLAGFCLAALLIPLAPPAVAVALPMLIAASFLMASSGQVCAINVESMCQSATPDHLLGRVNGAFRFLCVGLAPLGALGGGLLGVAIGPRAALFAAVAGLAIAPALVWCSPVRRLTEPPRPVEGTAR
ncbi:MFS transporter [Actinophytocola sp.]|uniref:MFS transporter n=1 Tax=Actinophytocola sp. TaxID=1872138 RepID=UPI0025B864EF|nr:MFS transporter [Actinophytocola sp.]